MKRILITMLSLLAGYLGFSQVTAYSYTIKLGPANNQVSVYAKPVGSGLVKWQQIEVVVGFQTSEGVPAGTWAVASSLNSMFGVPYSRITNTKGTSKDPSGYTYDVYTLDLGANSVDANVTNGTEYLLGTITYNNLPGGVPFTPYLLDFADYGSSQNAATYIVDAYNNYYIPSDGLGSSFYSAANGGYQSSGSQLADLGAGNSAVTPTMKLLPLKLLSFTATAQSGKTNTALLSWTVAEQVNTSSFEVERSIDGKNYSKIGAVAAAGNYAGKQTYSFTDANAATGTNYYRLKMVDIDGKYTYSPVKTVLFDGKATENVFLSPNPTRGEFHVKGLTATSLVRVLDINGKVLQTYNGVNAYSTLNIAQLPSGVYLVQVIEEGKFGGTFKLVKE